MQAFDQMFCYVQSLDHVVRLSDGVMFKRMKFLSQHINFLYESSFKDEMGKVQTSIHPLAKEWLYFHQKKTQRKDMTYAPGRGRWEIPGVLNRWTGWNSSPVAGDIRPWVKLLDFLFPERVPEAAAARKWFEQWLAYQIQHPGAKMKTAAVLHGSLQGTGKSTVSDAMRAVYGGMNSRELDESLLISQFNSWLMDKQWIVAEEIRGKDKLNSIEKLKLLITSTEITINEKQLPVFPVPNRANFLLISNQSDSVCRKNAMHCWHFRSFKCLAKA